MTRWAVVGCLALCACAGEPRPKTPYVLPLTRPASAVAANPPTSQPPDLVNMTVRENRRGLNRCQSRFPEATGELDLSFFVDDSGKARNIRGGLDELRSLPMTACVTKFLESLTFPQPVRGTDQVYKAHFRPEELDRESEE